MWNNFNGVRLGVYLLPAKGNTKKLACNKSNTRFNYF